VEPPLKVKMEYGNNTNSVDLPALEEKIKESLRHGARVTPEIIWCPPGTLEKSMAKTPVFEKNY
jgi:phenylacetate-CoA ligase